MAQSDRQRLLERALALPQAAATDFFRRQPPHGVDQAHLRIIDDTALRTKLVDAGLAEGLQSPKGPQKIASIVRIYPGFDAPPPPRRPRNGRASSRREPAAAPAQTLPTLEEMESLLARLREVEGEVARELALEVDDRIERLKMAISQQNDEALEATYDELGAALEEKRALARRVRDEAFRRVQGDASFALRAHARLLRH